MARDITGRQTRDKVVLGVGTKVFLLTLGIVFLLAAIITPLVVLMSKSNIGDISYGDFIYQYNIKDGNVYYDIKKYIGQRTEEVVIPGEYNGAPVIGILKNAFNGNTSNVVRNIKKITFDTSSGNGISRIDSGAFVRLESLREFYLPDCVNKIESGAFSGCIIRGDFVVEDLSAFYKNTNGYIGAKMTLSSGAFSNCSVGGKFTVNNNSSKSIVPSEVMQAFGKLGAAKVELSNAVNVFDLGTYSFNTYLDLEELTIFTNKSNNNAGGAYTQNNFDLSNIRLLKKLNINYGDEENLLFGLTQKFVKAPIETVNVGFGVKSIGSKTFTGYSKLTTLNIENTQTDSNGALSENLEIGVDLNFVPSARYTGININLSSYNFGTKTALRFDYNNNAASGVTVETCESEKVYSCALTREFTSNFDGYKIHTLTIDSTIEYIYQLAFGSYFRKNLANDDYYKLNFAIKNNNKSAVKLSADIFGNGITTESLNNILGRIDVTGPHTAERADGTDIYVSFNTAPGSYAARHTYNGSIVFGNASIKVTFNKNYPESLTNFPFEWAREGATENPETVLISSSSSFKMPYNKLNSSNEYMIIGWADTPISASAQNDFTVTKNADGTYSYDDGTPIAKFKLNAENFPGNIFEYRASDWDNWTGFEFDTTDKVYKLNLYAMWQKKEYVTVTYVPDFIGGTVYETAGREPSIEYYVARVPKGGELSSEAIYLTDEAGNLVTSYDPSKENLYNRTAVSTINRSAMPNIYQYGRVFKGWSTTQGATEADADITKGTYTVTEDLILYAVWTEIKYQINFYADKDWSIDGNKVEIISLGYGYGFGQKVGEDFFIPTVEQLITNNSSSSNISAFKHVGYTFKAWDITPNKNDKHLITIGGEGEKGIEYWNNSERTMADFIDFIVANANSVDTNYKDLKTSSIPVNLYSYYRANEYTLKYIISAEDGENLASNTPSGLFGDITFVYGNDNKVTIADGKDYILKTGYSFIGWQIKQKIYNADGSYNTDWDILAGTGNMDPFNTEMLLRKKADIGEADNLTYDQAQVAENGIDFELKPIWQANNIKVIINPNNGLVNGGADKLGLMYLFNLNKPTLTNGTEVIENIFELITRAGHVLMGVDINAQGTIGEGDPIFVFNDKGQMCLKTTNAETGAEEMVPVTGESILKAYFGVSELTHEQGATTSVELFAYWRAHKYNLVVNFGDEGTLSLGEVTFGSGYKSITDIDEATKNRFDEIIASIKDKGFEFKGIKTENGELVYNETGKATKSTFDFAFNKEGEITLYPQTNDLKYKVKLVGPSSWVAGNKYGVDTITANKLSLTIGEKTLEDYNGNLEISLGEKIKITAIAGEYFHFKRAMFVHADGSEKLAIDDISAEYEITLSNLSSVSYDDNGERVIAISAEFERDDYKLIFKLSDAAIQNGYSVTDWGLAGKEDYFLTHLAADGATIEYIYAYVLNASGIENLLSENGGTLGFVKKADGTFSYIGWPTITLNKGHINNWNYNNAIVAANSKVSSLSEADKFLNGQEIILLAVCGDYTTNAVRIQAGGSLPQGFSLINAISKIAYTQTYREGGTGGGDAVWTEAEGAFNAASLRDKAAVELNITPNAGYTITGATNSTISGAALSGFAYADNQITFVMGQEAATITLTISIARYTIVFDSNGGYGGTPSSITCLVGQTVTLSPNTFARTGYVFLGWARDAAATAVEFGDGAEVTSLSTTNGATVTLYAVWGEKGTDGREGYTIEYNSNNIDINNNSLISAVSGTMSNQTGLKYTQVLDLYDNAFSAAGYTASCWFVSSEVRSGGTAWHKNVALKDMIAEAMSAGQDVEDTNKITLYVHWTANTYTLTLNAGSVTIDGVGTFSGAFADNGNAATLALSIKFGQMFGEAMLGGAVVGLVTPSLTINDNYVATFAGYVLKGTSNAVDANTQFTSESNVEIEATWNYTQGEYKLTLIANGGLINGNTTYETTVGAGNALSVLGGASLTLTRTGFTFVGWNSAQNGNGNTYTAESLMPAESLTLYAQWTATSYRVKLALNGGSGVTAGGAALGTFGDGDVFEVKFDEAFSLSSATKTGYAFKWWTVSGANTSTALWGASSDAINSKIADETTRCFNDSGDVWFKGLASTGGAEVTIKAYFVAKEYTVSIDMNRDTFGLDAGSGALNKTEIKGIYDAALTELSSISVAQAPTQKGYTITLAGLANKSSGGMAVTESIILNESNIVSINHAENKATIYAQWTATANQYTLTLNAGSAVVEGTTINAYFGTEGTTSTTCQFTFDDALISISVPTLVVSGYGVTYDWWVDFNSNGSKDDGEILSHEQLEALVWTYDHDVTAVAQWTISANMVNVKIIHMVENAENSNTTSNVDNGYKNYAGTKLTIESIKGLMGESLARAGLTSGEFDTEKKSSGGTGIYYLNAIRTQKDGAALGASDNVLVKGDGTTEIYMVYKRYTHALTVKFVAGVSQLEVAGKTSTSADLVITDIKFGASVSVELTVSNGYNFNGWTLTGDGSVSNKTDANITFTCGTTDTVLTPQFSLKTFTLKLNSRGVTSAPGFTLNGSYYERTVEYGTALRATNNSGVLDKVTLGLAGHKLADSNNPFVFGDGGTGNAVSVGAGMPASNTTVSVKWETLSYKATIKVVDESGNLSLAGFKTIVVKAAGGSDTGTQISNSNQVLNIKYGVAHVIELTLSNGYYVVSAVGDANAAVTTADLNKKDTSGKVNFTISGDATITIKFAVIKYDAEIFALGNIPDGLSVIGKIVKTNTNVEFKKGIKDSVAIKNIPYTGELISSRITLSSQYYHQTKWSWTAAGVQTESNVDGAYFVKPDSVYDASGAIVTSGLSVNIVAVWEVNTYRLVFKTPGSITVGGQTIELTSDHYTMSADGKLASYIAGTGFVADVSFGALGKVSDYVTLTFANGNYIFNFTGWGVSVDGTNKGTIATDAALNFTSDSAWFNGLNTTDRSEIVFTPNVEITKIRISLKLNFQNLTTDAYDLYLTEGSAFTIGGETATVGSEGVLTFNVALATNLVDILNSILAQTNTASGSGGAYTLTDEEHASLGGFAELVFIKYFTHNASSQTLDISAAGNTFTANLTRKTVTFRLLIQQDRYTQSVGKIAGGLLINNIQNSIFTPVLDATGKQRYVEYTLRYNSTVSLEGLSFTRTGFTFKNITYEPNILSADTREFFIGSSAHTSTAAGTGSGTSAGIFDGCTSSGLTAVVNWNLNAKKVTFIKLDGLTTDGGAAPDTNSAGWASAPDGYGNGANAVYNEEYDVYYGTVLDDKSNPSLGYYRIIPNGTAASGIKGNMPILGVDDAKTKTFGGWYKHNPKSMVLGYKDMSTAGVYQIGDETTDDSTGITTYKVYVNNAGSTFNLSAAINAYLIGEGEEEIASAGATIYKILYLENGTRIGRTYITTRSVSAYSLFKVDDETGEVIGRDEEISASEAVAIDEAGFYELEFSVSTLANKGYGKISFDGKNGSNYDPGSNYKKYSGYIVSSDSVQLKPSDIITADVKVYGYIASGAKIRLIPNTTPVELPECDNWQIVNGEYQIPKTAYDALLPELPVPTRDGYIFVNWNEKANGNGYYLKKGDKATQNEYYGKWKEGITFKFFTLKANAAVGSTDTSDYQLEQKISVPFGETVVMNKDGSITFSASGTITPTIVKDFGFGFISWTMVKPTDDTVRGYLTQSPLSVTASLKSQYGGDGCINLYSMCEAVEVANVTLKGLDEENNVIDFVSSDLPSGLTLRVNVGDTLGDIVKYRSFNPSTDKCLSDVPSTYTNSNLANEDLTFSKWVVGANGISTRIEIISAQTTDLSADVVITNKDSAIYPFVRRNFYTLKFYKNNGSLDNDVVNTVYWSASSQNIVSQLSDATNVTVNNWPRWNAGWLAYPISEVYAPRHNGSYMFAGKEINVADYTPSYTSGTANLQSVNITSEMIDVLVACQGDVGTLNVYAKWAAYYEVNYVYRTSATAETTVHKYYKWGATVDNKPVPPSISGLTFIGYYEIVTNKLFTDGSVVNEDYCQADNTGDYKPATITVKARYSDYVPTPNYTIILRDSINSGTTYPEDHAHRITTSNSYSLPSTDWEGHSISGWASSESNAKSGIVEYAKGQSVGSGTYWAVYNGKPEIYITYYATDTGEASSWTLRKRKSETVISEDPTTYTYVKDGVTYTGCGWATTEARAIAGSVDYNLGSTVSQSMSLYCVYQRGEIVRIDYYATDTGETDSWTYRKTTLGNLITVDPSNYSYVKNGYIYVGSGWATTEERAIAGTVDYNLGDTVPQSMRLYCVYGRGGILIKITINHPSDMAGFVGGSDQLSGTQTIIYVSVNSNFAITFNSNTSRRLSVSASGGFESQSGEFLYSNQVVCLDQYELTLTNITNDVTINVTEGDAITYVYAVGVTENIDIKINSNPSYKKPMEGELYLTTVESLSLRTRNASAEIMVSGNSTSTRFVLSALQSSYMTGTSASGERMDLSGAYISASNYVGSTVSVTIWFATFECQTANFLVDGVAYDSLTEAYQIAGSSKTIIANVSDDLTLAESETVNIQCNVSGLVFDIAMGKNATVNITGQSATLNAILNASGYDSEFEITSVGNVNLSPGTNTQEGALITIRLNGATKYYKVSNGQIVEDN